MQNVLKNLLSLILSQRNGYKLREKKMRFAMGSSTKNPYQRQSYIKHDSRTERSDNHALHSYKCIVFLFDFVIAKWIIFMWVNWNINIEFIYIFFLFHSEATTITSNGSHVPCLKHTTELGEEEGVYQLALSQPVPPNPPVSMFDLFHALQVSRLKYLNPLFTKAMSFGCHFWGINHRFPTVALVV